MSKFGPERLLEIKAMCDAATRGPWTSEAAPRFRGAVSACVGDREAQVASADGQAAMFDSERGLSAADVMHANAAFIAESRTLVPEMVEEIETLRARRDELLATINRLSREVPYDGEAEEAKQRVAALVAEVGTLRSNARAFADEQVHRNLTEVHLRADVDRLERERKAIIKTAYDATAEAKKAQVERDDASRQAVENGKELCRMRNDVARLRELLAQGAVCPVCADGAP